jgi:hypothetical protein
MYLRREVEAYVRGHLAEEFGQAFSAEVLALRTGGRHEFDAVAADKSVVASIKSSSGLTSGGNMPNGKVNDCLAELYYLTLVDAPIRRLVLTTPAFFDIFTRRTVGAVSVDIEVVCVPLPPDIQAKVNNVVLAASREMTPGAAASAIAAEVETELRSPEPAS